MKIYLIGMPGSGKTTLGKQLAESLMLEFIDLDNGIEKHEGKSIPEIFREKGEDYFRQVESATLRQHAGSPESFVMATGGGAPCFYKGIEVINQSGISVFLDVTVSEIMDRLSSKEDRPLLQSTDEEEKKAKLNGLRDSRLKIYQHATVTVQNPTLESVLKAIRIKK